ncbi:MAG: NB-ARC domain-containing protein, partial [Streptosporangiaceae bacterium]
MTSENPQQIAIGSYIAQASHGSTAISAQQLVLVLGGELSQDAKVDLLRNLTAAVGDLSRTVVVDQIGNLIGEGQRYVVVENATLRAALASVARQGPAVPLQLPIDVIDFTNRDTELDKLDRLVCDNPGTACVYGMGGVGKSSLVTRFAHMRQRTFTDGILWGDLRHQDTASVLDMFAYSYNVDLSTVTDLRAKTNVVKALLATKRALVILDNAEHAPHLELLMNVGGQVSIIITTRKADTPELRGKPHLMIETFPENVALEHFTRVLGYELNLDQQSHAARLAASLGYLPLGLDIGIRLTKRARMGLEDFVELLDQSSPSTILVDESRSLGSCFHVSWDILTKPQQRALFSVTILDSPSIDVTALAAINKQSTNFTRYMMGDLVASSLVSMT